MKNPKKLAKEFDNIDFVEFIAEVQKNTYNECLSDILRHTKALEFLYGDKLVIRKDEINKVLIKLRKK